jgi:hypothetical protein
LNILTFKNARLKTCHIVYEQHDCLGEVLDIGIFAT